MGGIKTKGRGKDKKKRKSRKSTATKSATEPETVKPDILRNIIKKVSEKIKKPEREGWSLDIGPRVESQMLGRHVFKGEIEIDLKKL